MLVSVRSHKQEEEEEEASLVSTRIVCIGAYSILCDFSAFTNFSAYTRIQSEKVEIAVIIAHLT